MCGIEDNATLPKMRIDVVTIFPGMFAPVMGESIIKRVQEKMLVRITTHNLRG
ncbi:MAG: hypothetical protein ACE5GG_02215 [Candidatus Omnitrophota bacterium]